MSASAAIEAARQRAQRRAQVEAPPPELTPQQQAHLAKLMDESISREWYAVTKDDGVRVEVCFNPRRTLAEAQSWYPPRFRVEPLP